MPSRTQGGAYLPKMVQSAPPEPIFVIPGDALIDPDQQGPGVYWLTKATAAAITLVPASTVPLGTVVTFMAGNAVAHVVTVQSGGMFNGATGTLTKWTSAAFAGSSITLIAAPNGGWAVLAQVLGTVA